MQQRIPKQIQKAVKSKIDWLDSEKKSSAGKAALAKLRRGTGKEPGELPEVWALLFQGMPEELYGKGDRPSSAEQAVYTALTLFAVHSQGTKFAEKSCCCEGTSLGKAAASLVDLSDSGSEERILKRLEYVASARNIKTLSTRLRGLIQLLRGAELALDYPELASQIYKFSWSDSQKQVKRKWAEDFFKTIAQRKESLKKEKEMEKTSDE